MAVGSGDVFDFCPPAWIYEVLTDGWLLIGLNVMFESASAQLRFYKNMTHREETPKRDQV